MHHSDLPIDLNIMDKRTFLRSLGLLGLAVVPSVHALEQLINDHSHIPPEKLAGNEDFWGKIRQGYRLKPEYINLENGFYCMQPDNKKIIVDGAHWSPLDPARSCGIANVGIKGIKPKELAKILMDKYKIFTVAIDGQNVHGCRITPNVYTTPEELDVFVGALRELGS